MTDYDGDVTLDDDLPPGFDPDDLDDEIFPDGLDPAAKLDPERGPDA